MKKILKATKKSRAKMLYTGITIFSLVSVFVVMTAITYLQAEEFGYENLHYQTKEIRDDINLQMLSDRENLITMANFAAKLYTDGEDFGLLINSFKSIGLIENIGILMPDNTMLTKAGEMEAPADLDFDEEVRKGMFISGKVADATSEGHYVVRSSVPVMAGDETVAILYGIIELDTLEERYLNDVALRSATLYVLERENGNFIIDTQHNKVGNIETLKTREFLDDYTYEQMYNDIKNGDSGFTSFISAFTGEVLYLHYAALDFGDWVIMLSEPEKNVFAEAHETEAQLLLIFAVIILIMVLYVYVLFALERKQTAINTAASSIRKLLLEINNRKESIEDALKKIIDYSGGRSGFYVDTEREFYKYVSPSFNNKLLSPEERKYFGDTLMDFAHNIAKDTNATVKVLEISADDKLKKVDAKFYEFIKKTGFEKIVLSCVFDSGSDGISIIGIINPDKKKNTRNLLEEISVCFSMAIYNKKYLNRTETLATTDSLTGLYNRTVFAQDIKVYAENMQDKLCCIYVDVNELHIINNMYGHSSGDDMLIYVADALKAVFDGCNIYRIGGDEYFVFVTDAVQEDVETKVGLLIGKVEEKDYHISVGIAYGGKETDMELLIKEAETKMYNAKAEYYQKKEQKNILSESKDDIKCISTGNSAFDSVLDVMRDRYVGVYKVNLSDDSTEAMLMPMPLIAFSENETKFSKIFARYVNEFVNPDYHRSLLNFMEYDVLKKQIEDGIVPGMLFEKLNGDKFRLSIHPVENSTEETMWIVERGK